MPPPRSEGCQSRSHWIPFCLLLGIGIHGVSHGNLDVPLEVRMNGEYVGYNLLKNGVSWGYNPFTNRLRSSWDIQEGGRQVVYQTLRNYGKVTSKKEGQKNLGFRGVLLDLQFPPVTWDPRVLRAEPICWVFFSNTWFFSRIPMEHRAKTYPKQMCFCVKPMQIGMPSWGSRTSLALLCGFSCWGAGEQFCLEGSKLWLHQVFKIKLWHFTKWEACHMMRSYQLIHALPRMHKSIHGWCVRSSRFFAKTVGHVQERTSNGLVDLILFSSLTTSFMISCTLLLTLMCNDLVCHWFCIREAWNQLVPGWG